MSETGGPGREGVRILVDADTPMGAKAAELFQKFNDEGNGGLDFSAIIRLLGKPS